MFENEFDETIDRVSRESGCAWNDDSKIRVMARFLADHAREDEFEEFVKREACDAHEDKVAETAKPKPPPLTFHEAQYGQPWTVPYSPKMIEASGLMPHVYGTHTVLHAAKSVGKLAVVFEALDHGQPMGEAYVQLVRDMAADLVTAALRLANLYHFVLADELERRVAEKNGTPIRPK